MVIKLKKGNSKDKKIEEIASPLSMPADFNTAPKSMQQLEKTNSQGRDKEEEQQPPPQQVKQPKDKKSLILKQIDNFFF
jgi:hypothetical protein